HPFIAVKEAVLPWERFPGSDVRLSPEMRSTGEVMGMDLNFALAFYKSQVAAGSDVPLGGSILFSLADADKHKSLPIARDLVRQGFKIVATEATYDFFKKNGLEVEKAR